VLSTDGTETHLVPEYEKYNLPRSISDAVFDRMALICIAANDPAAKRVKDPELREALASFMSDEKRVATLAAENEQGANEADQLELQRKAAADLGGRSAAGLASWSAKTAVVGNQAQPARMNTPAGLFPRFHLGFVDEPMA